MADTEVRDRGREMDGLPPQEPPPHQDLRNPGGSTHAEFDRDVDLKGVVWTGVLLVGMTAVAFVLAWVFFQWLTTYSERRDPEPSPMPEMAEPVEVPGPRLQATPEMDLEAFRAAEEEMLEGYAPVAGEEGYARIPIERAMEMVVERGLGNPALAEVEVEPYGGVEEASGPLAPEAADAERAVEPAGLEGDEEVETPVSDEPPGAEGRR